MDTYLKATDEAALYATLLDANVVRKAYDPTDPANQRPADLAVDAEWSPSGKYSLVPTPGINLDVIGVISVPTGETKKVDDRDVPVFVPLPGYHANVRGDLTEEQLVLLPVIPKPNNPRRVWAGDN